MSETLARHGANRPLFLWCYIEVDQQVHRTGYNAEVGTFLDALEAFARELASGPALVIAH
ncbi:hypothetical protein [Streptomyces regalis]|uniref:Uncharacterized protein n=1 Tax=Streptomyces regalis TaxID=68262 RepID=A0A101J9G4_9ACTN|nr:hypothetical protein [Streptomyces regalis]KUL22695.1 hypothetical protein ADL12_41610 [Streptomyces regalis]